MLSRREKATMGKPAAQAWGVGFVPVLWLTCSIMSGCGVAAAWGPFARVEPGIEYIHRRIGDGPLSIHVVKIDRSREDYRFSSALAGGTVYGLAGVSEQVAALPANLGRPLAAVNGDFFVIRPGPYQGDPQGLHIVQGELVSAAVGDSLWIDAEGRPHMGPVRSRFQATFPNGYRLAFGLNQQRTDTAAVLYTPTIGTGTRTSAGLELVLEPCEGSPWLPLRAGQTYRARIHTLSTRGNASLRADTMVLSIGPGLIDRVGSLEAGMEIELSLETSPDLTGVQTALGGGPILLRDGKEPTWKPNQVKHPRTVIGWSDTHFVLVVVDGRQQGLSIGMTYPELAALMTELACTHAMNLDGGGSSTLWLGGQVMNRPSDGRERKVANSLILVARQP